MENEWIENLQRLAASTPIVSKVWIFGSRAKGTHSEASDLDVAVSLNLESSDEAFLTAAFSLKRNWRPELDKLFKNGPTIDLDVVFDDDEIVFPAVLEHGIQIYLTEISG